MSDYRVLTLAELADGLQDLLNDPSKQLLAVQSKMFLAYQSSLQELFTSISALPESRENLPFAEALAEEDRIHDQLGLAARYLCLALVEDPQTDAGQRALVENLLSTMVPEAADLRVSYAQEVTDARVLQQKLSAREQDLRSIAIANGRSLFEMLTNYVESAARMSELLSARANQIAESTPTDSGAAVSLRGRAVSLLIKLRKALKEEITMSAELPKNLDIALFARIDELTRLAEARLSAKRSTPSKASPTNN